MTHSNEVEQLNGSRKHGNSEVLKNSFAKILLLSASSLSLKSLVSLSAAALPALALTAPTIAHAQPASTAAVGDQLIDPVTGEKLAVIAVLDGAVLVEGNLLVITNPAIGAMVPDPADGSAKVTVASVSTSATTGLVDMLTLTDGRTIAVVRDVSAQVLPSATPDGGFATTATPLPEADETRNTRFIPRNASNGTDGDDASIANFNTPSAGGGGGSLSAVTASISDNIEANGDTIIGFQFRNSGIAVYANGGDGGDGGDGGGFLGITSSGRNGGAGSAGPSYSMTNGGTISVSRNGLFGLIVSSSGGDGGDGGDGAFGFTSNAGNGGRAGAGGNATAINAPFANITTYGRSGHGIYVRSLAGGGGTGGDADISFDSEAGDAGRGANGGNASALNNGAIFTFGTNAHGILSQSIGGTGGAGGDASGLVAFAGSAAAGGNGGTVTIINRGLISTTGISSVGALGQSIGGGGGDSGNAGGLVAIGAPGGAGSNGGFVTMNNAGGTVLTEGTSAFGLLAQSIGGGGGSGGIAGGLVAIGSSGSGGGNGGTAIAQNTIGSLISTLGDDAHGILVQSIGGGGGTGGTSGGLVSLGGRGSSGGNGGSSTAINTATITTGGEQAYGVLVQSIGGGGGNGGVSGGAVSLGGASSGGGSGGFVTITNSGLVQTSGLGSDAIHGQSIGGGGGSGGASGGIVSLGGTGSGGGAGGSVTLSNTGTLLTTGAFSRGIMAQSIGGGGGSGGASGGVIAIGGRSSRSSSGGTVTATNEGLIQTNGLFSNAIQAQSIGGGGGDGGSTGGLITVGGRAGGGGSAGLVTVNNSGSILTATDFSNGIFAQSVGGGGGNGGQATSISAFVGVSVGGGGGSGGSGGKVVVNNSNVERTIDGVVQSLLPVISTAGNFSNGVFAQSVGGGGGNGGAAVQGTIGAFGAVSVAVGGRGGSGGRGGEVEITGDGVILTDGEFTRGLLAQSVGGGGGNGGSAISIAASGGAGGSVSISVGVGGSGGSGGNGGLVNLNTGGFIGTSGNFSNALLAQSVGGGGGNGGFSVSAAAAVSDGAAITVPVGVGGTGGGGGLGGTVDLDYAGNILTEGEFSDGIIAQSVGGGGGNGGFNISATVPLAGAAAGGVAVGVGGSGGNGGRGGTVNSNITGNLTTIGDYSNALIAQSVGGAGGNGAFNVSGSLGVGGTAAGAISVGVGGSGAGAGVGGTVTSNLTGNIMTTGEFSDGFLAQSVGGGGGNGAFNVSGSIAGAGTGSAAIAVGVGGAGGGGGSGGNVNASLTGDAFTTAANANAFVAQSLGGGGGNGGVNVSGTIGVAGTGSGSIAIGVGGSGGGAGSSGTVTATVTGDSTTEGDDADAILAQSVGGGGGNGGVNVAAGISATSNGGSVAVGVGGAGGGGGDGGNTNLTITGLTQTMGASSNAVVSQSLGGGGGNGGINVSGTVTLSSGVSGAIGVGVGGFGGSGGAGGEARLTIDGDAFTFGEESTAVVAQSLGGGGGNGGINVTGAIAAASSGTGALGVGIGGFGGGGGNSGLVNANIAGTVMAQGLRSNAILAQSLGGGGGNGAINVSAGIALSSTTAIGGSVGIGGFGGGGGNGGAVSFARTGDTMTSGSESDAIVVQSIGGGGGNGGLNVAGGLTFAGSGTSIAGAVGIGGFGGEAGNGGGVSSLITGNVVATGLASDSFDGLFSPLGGLRIRSGGSHGILAQSVGGSGGSGGVNISGGIGLSGSGGSGGKSLSIGIGGFGGKGGNGNFTVLIVNNEGLNGVSNNGDIQGIGDNKAAVLAQSIGGGGGDGGLNIAGGVAIDGTLTIGIGGFGSEGGSGGNVGAGITSDLFASGTMASGLLAQSVGGGGGNGAVNISGGISAGTNGKFPAVVFGMGGNGGAGNSAGTVIAEQVGTVMVEGVMANGVLAQSIGGGGGTGGLNVAAAVGQSKNFNLAIGVGGSGGAGADGSAVTLTSDGAIMVDGRGLNDDPANVSFATGYAKGLHAQSIGGGGGSAGLNITGAGTNEGAPLTLGIGGSGANGGKGGDVIVNRGLVQASSINVMGDFGTGLLAQSIGSGGGNAAGNIILSASLKAKFDAQVVIGGSGGTGGDGGAVNVNHIGDIFVEGNNSRGLVAQSIGGGGGEAAFNLNASLVGDRKGANGEKPGTKTLDLAIGGGPGDGSDGGIVTVDHSGVIQTLGSSSTAVLAQSIGGGGGNAAENYSQNINDQGSISVAIGRIGGTGGVGGAVDVTTADLITTAGNASHAVHAQSIGGGGGNSETTSVSVEGDRETQRGSDKEKANYGLNLEFALGLEGGAGSKAGIVTVANSATISTLGDNSHGVFAQSIGGGGGNGGAAIIDRFQEIPGLSFDDAEEGGSLSIAFQVGGSGGSSAEGGAVTATNSGMIMSSGMGSSAIKAQSIGGGGGDGGAAFNVDTLGKSNSASFGVALGGNGGTGALGGAVSVTNTGLLQTTGEEAAAIYAQSIGGGGGNAGLAGNYTFARPDESKGALTVAYNLGGIGGSGGAAGTVLVANGAVDQTGASILTTGDASHGIFAQSIGGGGGNGGSTLSGNFATGSNNVQLALTVGGDGGIGGIGGLVTVDNFGSIQTSGEEAHGIFAQSIGGGGGNGGLSLASGNLIARRAFPKQALVALGGSGGMGNDAGNVIVTNNGSIFTSGKNANGILAQSLGGGGGNMSVGVSTIFLPAVNFITNVAGLIFGGRGGEGGLGGEVTVNHNGNIVVTGDGARGIVAESINGGGGGLVIDFNGIAGFAQGDLLPGFLAVDEPAELPVLTIFGGAAGRGDSNAEKVTVNLNGAISVAGNDGAGIFQQAIGGGGGHIDLNLNFTDQQVASSDPLALDAGLGGRDGANNNGGEIASVHVGNIMTEGRNTSALFLQSIGGGGGGGNLNLSGPQERLGDIKLSLGGTNLTNSAGGVITHAQTGSISTTGEGAIGAIVQSIGGGGGYLNLRYTESAAATALTETQPVDIAISTTEAVVVTEAFAIDENTLPNTGTANATAIMVNGNLTLGGAGGSELNGGNINFAMDGNVITQDNNAAGLLLQSIGAGGGQASLAGIDGLNITLGGSGAAQGDGGDIIFTNTGTVMTTGGQSHGVVIQSIGGGGGAIFGDLAGSTVDLSTANNGSGGAIAFTQIGDITTMGANSFGIIAQSIGGGGGLVGDLFMGSAGGAGSGDAITLDIQGDIMASGNGSTAVFAQSLGSGGGGNISLTLAEGQQILAGEGGTTVAFDGGADNIFENNGSVMTLDGLTGTAITGTSGNDTINNSGMIIGNIALGGGANSFTNLGSGTFISASALNLGASENLFTNSGLLTPGDLNTIQTTALSGGFSQTSTGSTFVEVDLADETFDAINATGTTAVSGNLDVRLLNPTQFTPGMFSAQIFTGAQGASMDNVNLRADSSVVLNLLGLSVSGNAVQVDYDLTFAPAAGIGNRALVGDYLNRVQAGGVPGALSPTFNFLIEVQNETTYVDLLTQLGSEFYAEQNAHALRNAQNFSSRMINCGATFDRKTSDKGGTCAWAEFNIDDGRLDANLGMPSITSDTKSFSGGAHYQMGGGLGVAMSVGYSDYDLAGYGNLWVANGNAKQAGVGANYSFGDTQIGAYISVSGSTYQTMRTLPGFGGLVAASKRKQVAITGELAASNNFRFGDLSVTPSLNIGMTKLSRGGGLETGAGPNDLALSKTSDTHSWAMPGVQLSYDAALSSNWNVRPFVGGALRQYLSSPFEEASARFAFDSSGADTFLSTTPLDRSHFIGEAGLEFYNNGGISISGSYNMEKSKNRKSDRGSIRLVVPF